MNIGSFIGSMVSTLLCVLPLSETARKNLETGISQHIRSLAYPDGSGTGIFLAIGIPIDVPDKSISFSFYFEANYQTPHIDDSAPINASLRKRTLDRQTLYDTIQNKFDSYGYRGRACLQRAICESAQFPLAGNGLVGDLLRIIFTPTSSLNENLGADIEQAQFADDCRIFEKDCSVSLLDLISDSYEDSVQDGTK